MKVTNRGPGPYDGPLKIIDTAPAGWGLFGGFPSPPWSCEQAGDAIECQLGQAALGPGDTISLDLELRVPQMPADSPDVENCAGLDLGSNIGDPDPSNNGHCVAIKIAGAAAAKIPPEAECPEGQDFDPIERTCVPTTPEVPPGTAADLGLSKMSVPGCRAPGSCVFHIEVTNHGPNHFEGPLQVTDDKPAGWSFYGGFPAPLWSCTESSNAVTCRQDRAELPPGESIPLDLEFMLAPQPDGPPEVENCATLSGSGGSTGGERQSVSAVQQALNELGFKAGPVDGVAGRQTRAAVARFQQDRGLAPTGEIDDALVAALFPSAASARDQNVGNDRACATTQVLRPPAEEGAPPPEEPSPPPVEEPSPPPAVTPPPPPQAGQCPLGQVKEGDRCVCPEGQRWDGQRCVPRQVACPPGQSPDAAGRCVCPEGQRWDGKRCVPRQVACPPGQSPDAAGRCVCPQGQRWDGKRCVPRQVACPPGQSRDAAGRCVCPEGQRWDGKRCVPRQVACPPGQSRDATGRCVCPQGQRWDGKRCVPRAPAPKPTPAPGLTPVPGHIICPTGTVWHPPSQQCIEPPE